MSATLADAASSAAAGQKVDAALVFREVKDSAVGLGGESLGPASGIMNVYVNIGIDAYRGDRDSVAKGALLDQTVEKSKLMLDLVAEAEKAERGGNAFAAPVVKYGLGLVVAIATAGRTFATELETAGDAYLDAREEIKERRRAIRRTLANRAAALEEKVQKLQKEIDLCFVVAPQTKR